MKYKMDLKLRKTFGLLFFFFSVTVLSAKNIEIYNNIAITDNSNSKAVMYAVKALKKDFNVKFGTTKSSKEVILIELNIDKNSKDFDSYKIEISDKKIIFNGTDELGLIHAIYAFSEDYLGIDPFIYFTDIVPEMVSSIKIKTGKISSKKYTYKHRVFFVNDEDLIVGFEMEKLEYGFNLEFMEKFYETMLRLKMTGVIPSTLVLADEVHLKLASDMGLYIAQHHAEPVGSVPLYWPKNIPYSWSTHKEYFVKFWRDAIERQKGKNVIWTLNFRGLLDRAFWDDDPSMSRKSSAAEKAKIVNEVIETQYNLIKEIRGEEDPLVCGYLWGELGGMYRDGLINYPKNTMILFSDQGYGTFPEGTWKSAENTKLGKGVYQHVSYHNRRTHLRINTIHPDVLHREMDKAITHGLTDMIVLNVGNFKEKIFGVQQMVNYMNDFDSYKNQPNGNYYFDWYAKDKFNTSSQAVVQSYKDFFTNQFDLGDPERKPGDEWYFFYVERLLNMAYQKEMDPSFFKKEFPGKGKKAFLKLKDFNSKMDFALDAYSEIYNLAEDKWAVSVQHTLEAKGELKGSRLNFYTIDMALPTEKMFNLTGMAADFSKSLKYYLNKEYHKSQLAAYAALEHAKKAVEIEKRIEQNGSGKFKDWYRWDETALTYRIEEVLENYILHVKDLKFFNLEYKNRNSKTPGIQYKYQPFFDSKYQKELIYMENAD
ncbi:glycosyl hydrolase 115 family protein [Polaribacter sp. Q13]|uniref:glycosyl hydrolase 115 family protein n=1 Tax=Polaribacter sp. Q13 TaxID=2806551 RepID=UPI00193BC312|nr:glycosyl hydrolase 115 family protein [Polaribacter sp. Q13]QVY66087.1 glycosyl hydrolase 115 family protein [Polaribacter sp. Q13]